MSPTFTRRTFVKSIAYAGAAAPLVTPRLARAVPASDKLRHVGFGTAGMGWVDLQALAKHPGFELTAVCEVDAARLSDVTGRFPNVRTYSDWRVLLDKEGKNFDSANVSVPDHTHAPISMSLIHRGKHVYTQKPLTHDVYEARKLRLAAEKTGVVTQMGIQGHALQSYRIAIQLIQSGVIGKVKEVHAWVDKSWGGGQRPDAADPVPPSLDWDLWLGTAPARPFARDIYHPFYWRRWLDFGTGTLGDMACHLLDTPYKATGVTAPLSVTSLGPAPFQETWPTEAQVHYTFAGTKFTTDPVSFTWYDGGRKPPPQVLGLLDNFPAPPGGAIVVAEQGALLISGSSAPRLFPSSRFEGHTYPRVEVVDHWLQFADACTGKGRTSASFSYAGPLTETVLLGTVAMRLPHEELKWNAAEFRFTNNSAANDYLRREYRKGWEVEGLS